MKRIFTRCFIWLLVSWLTPVASARAHSPLFSESNHSPQTALEIRDPLKSWAVYGELGDSGPAAYFRMNLRAGERLAVILFTAQDPGRSGFLPHIEVIGPAVQGANQQAPSEQVLLKRDGMSPVRATYEPFTATWYYEVARINENAPESGIYYLRISDHTRGKGRYGLAVGYKEEWILPELVLLAINIPRIYLWEGQNIFVVLLPVLIVGIVGGSAFLRRAGRGGTPRGLAQWFAAFAGLSFLGSIAVLIYQALLSFQHTGISGKALITAVVALIPAVLAAPAFVVALRRRRRITALWSIALLAVGLLGLVLWSGLFMGPALAFAAALWPRREAPGTHGVVE